MNGRGINAHISTKQDIDNVVLCGCEWIRIDFDWKTIEPKKGQYNWNVFDTAVSYAYSKGLKIYASLAYTPSWINSDFRACPNMSNWVSFCQKVASRFSSRITVYGLWNEPNLKDFYSGSKNDYIKIILEGGYNAIKNVNKNFLVAAGDLATSNKSDWYDWFKLLKKHTDIFDIFSWHTYQDSSNEVISRYKLGKIPIIGWIVPKWRPFKWEIDDIRKKKNKQIFLTETGLKARTNKSSELKDQKDFVKDLEKIRKETDSTAIFIYELNDDKNINDKWGIFDESKNPKQSAQWLIENK